MTTEPVILHHPDVPVFPVQACLQVSKQLPRHPFQHCCYQGSNQPMSLVCFFFNGLTINSANKRPGFIWFYCFLRDHLWTVQLSCLQWQSRLKVSSVVSALSHNIVYKRLSVKKQWRAYLQAFLQWHVHGQSCDNIRQLIPTRWKCHPSKPTWRFSNIMWPNYWRHNLY